VSVARTVRVGEDGSIDGDVLLESVRSRHEDGPVEALKVPSERVAGEGEADVLEPAVALPCAREIASR